MEETVAVIGAGNGGTAIAGYRGAHRPLCKGRRKTTVRKILPLHLCPVVSYCEIVAAAGRNHVKLFEMGDEG